MAYVPEVGVTCLLALDGHRPFHIIVDDIQRATDVMRHGKYGFLVHFQQFIVLVQQMPHFLLPGSLLTDIPVYGEV